MTPLQNTRQICYVTTTAWNPGDEIIRLGTQHLIGNTSALLYSRNPDHYKAPWSDSAERKPSRGETLDPQYFGLCDGVVFAGSPEWRGPMLHEVYKSLAAHPDLPIALIGIGDNAPRISPLTELEKLVLKSPRTTITTRSTTLAETLTKALNRPDITALPCPSLFAIPSAVPRRRTGKTAIVYYDVANTPDDFSPALQAAYLKLATQSPYDDIITLQQADWRACRNAGLRPIHPGTAAEYLHLCRDYDLIASARLHGAIGALSAGTTAVLLSDGKSHRLTSTAKMYEHGWLPIRHPSLPWQRTQLIRPHALTLYKLHIAARYATALARFKTSIARTTPLDKLK